MDACKGIEETIEVACVRATDASDSQVTRVPMEKKTMHGNTEQGEEGGANADIHSTV